eukprot:TRINITY_DN7056_c0_g1_i1.p1 TRINITY_DN7056_c0_g1~~TRINITY_DN7056_c0_g1_i1.p1  ORF type:complete len:134 (+),score=30.72 TRINITY_DN7056_c0_g1_i1:104-505(+)
MPGYGSIRVDVVEAADLLNADSGKNGDVSDPFCRVNCNISDDGVQQTRCLQDTLFPKWNDTFIFKLNGPLREGILECWLLDKDFFSDDDLGRVKVHLEELPADKMIDRWFDLTLDSGEMKGKIHLRLEYKKPR